MTQVLETPEAAVRPQPRSVSLIQRATSLPEMRWAALSTALWLVGLLATLAHAPSFVTWPLFLFGYLAGGWEPAWAGVQALRERKLDVDLLMIVAAIGAAAIGQVVDGGLLIVIFAISGGLEALATARTADSVRSLLDLMPASTAAVGDVLVVRPGERIGADGVVLDGFSEVDQSSITGESMPVNRGVGDEVFAGTANGTGTLRVEVTKPAADSVLARIVGLVEEASDTKSKTQLFVEKIEERYSIIVVAATLALFAIPLAFGGEFTATLLRAMTFMIVASPCAVVLSTMPPLLSAIANAGRHGVLIKSAVALEQLGTTTITAFDKTGTLSFGKPAVTDIVALQGHSVDVLAIAAAVEHASEHALGRAIVAAAGGAPRPVQDFRALPGKGVSATLDGVEYQVLAPNAKPLSNPRLTELQESGHTVVVVWKSDLALGLIAVQDTIRPTAATVVADLLDTQGNSPVLLTGDNQVVAEGVASSIGIADVKAELLPQDKVAAIRSLEQQEHKVLMVGDGINDAPALASATASIAMGQGGADLALDTADAVLVHDDITAIAPAVALSRRARRFVVANLSIAAAFIIVLVAWDLFGTLPLPLGVAGHEGSTIIVALNGMRLLRSKAWR